MLAVKLSTALALAAIAVAPVLTACGGGGVSSTSATADGAPMSKQELIARGDTICRQARGQFEQLQQNPPTTAEGAATLTQRLVDISETELSQLRDLNAPGSLQSRLDGYLKALEQNIAVLKQGLRAAQQNDAAAYAKAQAKTVSEQVKRLELARAVGFKECSRPTGTAPGSAGG